METLEDGPKFAYRLNHPPGEVSSSVATSSRGIPQIAIRFSTAILLTAEATALLHGNASAQ